MTYTVVDFSLLSGFKEVVHTQELVLVLNRDSQKYCLHQFFSTVVCRTALATMGLF